MHSADCFLVRRVMEDIDLLCAVVENSECHIATGVCNVNK